MLANIKAYQSETAVSALLHKTLLRVVHGSLVYKRITFGFD